MKTGALIDSTGQYRYLLHRRWEPGDQILAFIMLNPSTADAAADDPTIRRCIGFAQDWGFNGLAVANLYALRSTDPAGLSHHADPVGPENDRHLRRLMLSCSCLVAAWGVHHSVRRRVPEVIRLLPESRSLMCLGFTQDGYPRHPLFVPRSKQPEPYVFRPNAAAWPVVPATPDLFTEVHA